MKKLIYILLFTVHFNMSAQTWSSVDTGTNDAVWSLTVYNSELYAGGQFDFAGGLLCNKIAKWNGTNWDTIPNVPGGDNISALESYNGDLYMGRGNPPFIHMWNGSVWSLVGPGLNNVVVDMIEFNSELYAGGLFTTAGGNPASHIAKWNGTSWSNVGIGVTDDVLSLATYNGELYAGGRFNAAITKWNGSNWLPLGIGISGGDVYALAVYNGDLYVGGNFTTAGGIAAPGIARWNGTSWSTVSTGIIGFGVVALGVYNGELYAGGDFTSAGTVSANNIAKWDGTNWSVLGSGTNGVTGYVGALAVYSNQLYVSGGITDAGGIPLNNIARWSTATAITENDSNNSLRISPNPFNNELLIKGTNHKGKIVLFDLAGKEIMRCSSFDNETTINTASLLRGFYLLKYEEQTKSVNQKLMKFF